MMKKKIVSKMAAALMMALVMTTPLQALAAEEEVVNTQSTGEIQLTLTSDQQTPQYSYGETKDLNLQLKNSGTEDVTGVAIVPNIEAGTGAWPFEIENKDYRLEIGEIKAGQSVPVTYTLQARGDVASQYYKVGFTIFYNQEPFFTIRTKHSKVSSRACILRQRQNRQTRRQRQPQPPRQRLLRIRLRHRILQTVAVPIRDRARIEELHLQQRAEFRTASLQMGLFRV